MWWLLPTASLQAAMPFVSAPLTTPRYCSTWAFQNNTGQDVNDLHVRLAGVKSVSAVYTGTLNPFGAPDNTSGYDSTANAYRLNFSGAMVYDSDRVQIGLCTDTPLLRLDASGQPPFVWTKDNTTVTPNPRFTGLEWIWIDRTHLRVRVVNEHPMTTTLFTLNLLDADNALMLDDLNADVSNQLPLVLELLTDPLTIPPRSDRFFDVFFDVGGSVTPPDHAPLLEPNHAYIIEALLADASDEANSAHLVMVKNMLNFAGAKHLPNHTLSLRINVRQMLRPYMLRCSTSH